MINYQLFGSQKEYVDTVVNMISGFEGQIPRVKDIGDHQATIGYGYTFNRSNNLAIWTAAGISLTSAQKKYCKILIMHQTLGKLILHFLVSLAVSQKMKLGSC